ncbi:MAG: carboxypeptidase-like regulatory domain-containing protein [Methylotenera sp.]
MKNAKLIFAAAVVFFGLNSYATAMGYLPPEDLSDTAAVEKKPVETTSPEDSATETNLQKCIPHKKIPDEICYISGGISADEVSDLKSLAKDFLLEIVFVQKADTEVSGRIEEYLASVKLQIKDAKGNIVLDTTTDGPFFLADLPPGKYKIIAEHDEVVKSDLVRIDTKKHQRTVFLWDR